MRRYGMILFVLAGLAATLALAQTAEKPWFDMENCAFCKEIAKQPGLMEHMSHEYHNISTGIVSVSYIDGDYKGAFKKAQEGMMAVAQNMKPGQMPAMCQHCSMIGEFMMKGVKMDEVQSKDCIIFIYSSTDSATVAQIQEFGRRSAEEGAKIKAKMLKAE